MYLLYFASGLHFDGRGFSVEIALWWIGHLRFRITRINSSFSKYSSWSWQSVVVNSTTWRCYPNSNLFKHKDCILYFIWFGWSIEILPEQKRFVFHLVNKREISASKKRCSGWDRSRVRGYLKKNQRELFISMLFQCYLKMTHLHIHVHKNIYIIKIYNNTTNQISYSDT